MSAESPLPLTHPDAIALRKIALGYPKTVEDFPWGYPAFKVDGTDMGFKPVKLIPGPEGVNAVQESCNMKRPS